MPACHIGKWKLPANDIEQRYLGANVKKWSGRALGDHASNVLKAPALLLHRNTIRSVAPVVFTFGVR